MDLNKEAVKKDVSHDHDGIMFNRHVVLSPGTSKGAAEQAAAAAAHPRWARTPPRRRLAGGSIRLALWAAGDPGVGAHPGEGGGGSLGCPPPQLPEINEELFQHIVVITATANSLLQIAF
jgi:hypothetical protein